MRYDKEEHCRFVRWLDRTAEKNPVLWLPCIILLSVILGFSGLISDIKTVAARSDMEASPVQRREVFIGKKPFALRAMAVALVMMFFFGMAPEVRVFAEETAVIENGNRFAVGDGSVDNPYQIATAEQMNMVRNDLTANYVLVSDIDLSGYNWVPIGTGPEAFSYVSQDLKPYQFDNIPFSGKFDGDGHTISNLTINTSDYDSVGLFGYSVGDISNIDLVNVNIHADRKNIDYADIWNKYNTYACFYVGAVVGVMGENESTLEYASVSNCTVDGVIDVSDAYNSFVGGIAGHGMVSNSENRATITVLANKDGRSENDTTIAVGGIVGTTAYTNAKIQWCKNYGNIDATAGNFAYVGGISGEYGIISNSFNYGNIKGTVTKGGSYSGFADNVNVGGIVGANYSDDTFNVINYGDVEAVCLCKSNSLTARASAGGIIGFNGYYSGGLVRDAYNLGSQITATASNDITRVGRICGGTGGYGKLFENNYSVDTALVNGSIPTENIGADQINGESASLQEINDLLNQTNFFATYDFIGDDLADINKINMYKPNIQFYIQLTNEYIASYSGNIYLKRYSDGTVIKTIAAGDESGNLYPVENKIVINFSDVNSDFEPSTKYYFDLSEIMINNQSISANIDCKDTFNFTTDWGVVFGKETFKFQNNDSAFYTDTKKYLITEEFYNNEIKNSLSGYYKNDIINNLNSEWTGSCTGFSAVMLLQNENLISRKFPNAKSFENVGSYPVPSSVEGSEPYSSRDLLNYFQILNTSITRKHERTDKLTIEKILQRAANIKGFEDMFKLGYSYAEGGHAVVVIGGDLENRTLTLYDSNYNYARIEEVRIDNEEVYLGGVKIHNIDYVDTSDYFNFTPDVNENLTKIVLNMNNNLINIINSKKQSKSISSDKDYKGSLPIDDIYNREFGSKCQVVVKLAPYTPKDYFEINSSNGEIDYSIVNESMFFAAKADKAENSIVSAQDGIKLINANGKYEATVSANDMPYDMFDISGTANGNVVCEYTEDGVKVELDNSSDTSITFYTDLDTAEYNVPREYSSFIVGKRDDKAAVLADTDNDGYYDTDIVNNIATRTISIPQYVTVTRNGETLNNDSILNTGDVLTITVAALPGHQLISLKVNDTEISNGDTYTVSDKNVVITVEYNEITSPDIHDPTITPYSSRNIGQNNYENAYRSAHAVESYLTEKPGGIVERVESINGVGVVVEKYFTDGRTISQKVITAGLDRFGGFFSGEKYNFLVFGQDNPTLDENMEMIRIVKYTKNWNRLDSFSFLAKDSEGYARLEKAETKDVFRFGTLRMAETGDYLIVHTCHGMFNGHQSNMPFVITQSDMKFVSFEGAYCSHSFNQFVKTDPNFIYYADHGDCFPRAVVLTKIPVDLTNTGGERSEVLKISGEYDVYGNDTGLSVGGLELSENGLLIAGNSVPQSDAASYDPYGQRNIFVIAASEDFSDSQIKWLTNYFSGIHIGNPFLVKINSNRFAVMWEETQSDKTVIKYTVIDGKGNIVAPAVTINSRLSDVSLFCLTVIGSCGITRITAVHALSQLIQTERS